MRHSAMKSAIVGIWGIWASLLQPAVAQETTVSNEQGQLRRAQENITALGPDLLGDQVNLYNGALDFVQTDTSLPGNNALQVALSRRHTAGRSTWVRDTMGDWEVELPRISGVFPATTGWVNGAGNTARCSNFSAPPSAFRPVQPGAGDNRYDSIGVRVSRAPAGTSARLLAPSSNPVRGIVEFSPMEYWQGNVLSLPGGVSEELLVRGPQDSARPSGGLSWPLVTRGHWQIRCGGLVQNASGEAFTAVSPDGVTYQFDWMATRFEPSLMKAGAGLGRVRASLYATLVTDRFGNSVRYRFDPAAPNRLMTIQSSDGRIISLAYDAQGRVQTVNDGTRNFSYSYTATGELYRVTQPDQSFWEFNLRPLVHKVQSELGEGANCAQPGSFPERLATGTVRHPSGAIGTFALAYVFHPRADVRQWCIYPPTGGAGTTVGAVWPKTLASQSLVRKTINGPGLPAGDGAGSMTWRYAYDVRNLSSWSPCANCPTTKTLAVENPSGGVTRYTYGIQFELNEGQLLTQREESETGEVLRTTHIRYRLPTGMPYPEPAGLSIQIAGDFLAARHRPEDERRIEQQSTVFTSQVDPSTSNPAFDRFAKATRIDKFSSLNDIRKEIVEYEDNLGLWVLSQIKSVRTSPDALPIKSSQFSTSNAMPVSVSRFGKRLQSFEYAPDGTVSIVRDAADRPMLLQNYMRGSPQSIVLPDSNRLSQTISNLGEPISHTDMLGLVTRFGYDAMGSLREISYPGEPSGTGTYDATVQSFAQHAVDEFGISAGHWKQTVTRGNSRTVRYFDALWRPLVEEQYDLASPSTTSSYREFRFDSEGRKSFRSYPERTFDGVGTPRNGLRFEYDNLDRMVRQRADSELGELTTTHRYPGNAFIRVTTNPRGLATVFSFQAFDLPSEEAIRTIQAPESVHVAIIRDIFGKPLTITRGDSGYSVTRTYVYDEKQRLCKTIEPETGATQQGYDLANNVAWRASGLSPVAGLCDENNAPPTRRVNFSYDMMNRLNETTFGDGSPWVRRSYWPDGLPLSIETPDSTWTLGYNSLRKLQSETLTVNGWGTFGFSYRFNSAGSVTSTTYPGGLTLHRNPDGLGRATSASEYVSGANYHPDGKLAGYVSSNGVSYVAGQNRRLLLSNVEYGNISTESFTYDANGNVEAIGGSNPRTMGYDGLDRLSAANGSWGLGSFSYDSVDNIRNSTVGNVTRTREYADGTNRMTGIRGYGGFSQSYDANGNATTMGAQSLLFDIGNRLSAVSGVAAYRYDGNGRRTTTEETVGRKRLSIYGQSGQLLWSADTKSGTTQHLYLGDKLVAQVNSLAGLRWIHTDFLGSPIARTNASGTLLNRYDYEPYGLTTGRWARPDGIGYSGHVNDVNSGLVYMQQRYYDPTAGRFLSVDPITTDLQSAEHFNRYLYAAGNPYKYRDPDGRIFETAFDLVSFGLSVQEFRSNPSAGNAAGVVIDAAAVAIPGVPGGVGVIRSAISAANKAGDVVKGSAGGQRAGKKMTPAGKAEVKGENAALNNQQTTCSNCGQSTVAAKQSRAGVTPPGNETHVDHIVPKSKGGDGSPSNGQVLCRDCNLRKSDN